MRILIFGDSIVQGAFVTGGGCWANRLAMYVYEKEAQNDSFDISVFNLGISGDCTNRLLERFENEIIARLHDETEVCIVIAVGVNDTQRYVSDNHIKTERSVFEQNITILIQLSRKYTNKICFVGLLPIVESMVNPMPWADDRGHRQRDVIEYDDVLSSVCKNEKTLYISMPNVLGDSPDSYLTDGIHPNAEGHKLMFEWVKNRLIEEKII